MKKIVLLLLLCGFALLLIACAPPGFRADADLFNSNFDKAFESDNSDDAIRYYTEALKHKNAASDENVAIAYNNRGNVYYNMRDYDTAIADYTTALEYNSRYAPAYYNRGNAYDEKGDYDTAIVDYTIAITINPRHGNAYNNRGVAYSNKGDYDAAIADFMKALEIDPNNALASDNLQLERDAKAAAGR